MDVLGFPALCPGHCSDPFREETPFPHHFLLHKPPLPHVKVILHPSYSCLSFSGHTWCVIWMGSQWHLSQASCKAENVAMERATLGAKTSQGFLLCIPKMLQCLWLQVRM